MKSYCFRHSENFIGSHITNLVVLIIRLEVVLNLGSGCIAEEAISPVTLMALEHLTTFDSNICWRFAMTCTDRVLDECLITIALGAARDSIFDIVLTAKRPSKHMIMREQ